MSGVSLLVLYAISYKPFALISSYQLLAISSLSRLSSFVSRCRLLLVDRARLEPLALSRSFQH